MAKRRASGEGLVRQRESGRWEGRIVVGHKDNGEPIFRYLSADSQKLLLEKMHRMCDEFSGVDLSENCRMALDQWLDIWLRDYAAPSLRPSTLQGYRKVIENQIKPYLGEKQVCDITNSDVRRLYQTLLKRGRTREHPQYGHRLSAASVFRVHGVLRQAMDTAVRQRMTAKNPTEGVTLPRKEASSRKVLNDEQLERFMEIIKTEPLWHDFFYLDIMTGLRRGELCGLMWNDFDERKGTLTVRRTLRARKGGGVETGETKTVAGRRVIQLPPSLVQLLRERKKKSFSQWIFPNPLQPEMPVNPESGYRKLKELLKKAGLPDLRFHDLRHTFATHALAEGVDTKTLSGILGHTKPSFTLDTYTHVTDDMHAKAAEVVSCFMQDFLV